MSSIIRIRGGQLDINALLASMESLIPYSVFRKGDQKSTDQKTSIVYEESGAYFQVPDTDFQSLPEQFEIFKTFAEDRFLDLMKLQFAFGAETAYLDVAKYVEDFQRVPLQFDYIPADILQLLSKLKLGLRLAHWENVS